MKPFTFELPANPGGYFAQHEKRESVGGPLAAAGPSRN
jgi:hypothetical protein